MRTVDERLSKIKSRRKRERRICCNFSLSLSLAQVSAIALPQERKNHRFAAEMATAVLHSAVVGHTTAAVERICGAKKKNKGWVGGGRLSLSSSRSESLAGQQQQQQQSSLLSVVALPASQRKAPGILTLIQATATVNSDSKTRVALVRIGTRGRWATRLSLFIFL